MRADHEATTEPVTLPLFTPPGNPNGWHRVMAPGGYEWWRFEAMDERNDRQIIAVIGQGWPFHREYVRRYRRYMRHPTRYPPPVPQDFPFVWFVLQERARLRASFFVSEGMQRFSDVGTAHVDVSMADCSFRFADGGVIELTLRESSPPRSAGVSAQFTFRPRLRRCEAVQRAVCGEAHQWILTPQVYDVAGAVRLSGQAIDVAAIIPFNGRGVHDHQYGTQPCDAGPMLRAYIAQAEQGCVMLQVGREARVIEFSNDGVQETTAAGVELAKRFLPGVVVGDVMELRSPRGVAGFPIVYDATWRGRRCRAIG